MTEQQYRGRQLRLVEGDRVAVFDADTELYSTASNFATHADAFRAARALVDVELDGHAVTRPTNDPAGRQETAAVGAVRRQGS